MHKIGSSERPDLSLAVVVGAGGMGMAAARRLAQRHRILIADLDAEKVEQAAATLRGEGGDVTGAQCDVTNPQSVEAFARRAAGLGAFQVLAHVAGLSPSMGDFATILRVNLLGPALMERALLPLAGRGAAAIFIASLAGHGFSPDPKLKPILGEPLAPDFVQKMEAALGDQATSTIAYQLSKQALMAFCRRRAAAWGSQGARIVSLSPGLIATPMGALEFERTPAKHGLLSATPLQREGTMMEIADVIEFLASDRASFISGIDLLVDGGVAAALGFLERSEN